MKSVNDQSTFSQFLRDVGLKYQNAKFSVFNAPVFEVGLSNENEFSSLNGICSDWSSLMVRREEVWNEISCVWSLLISCDGVEDNAFYNPEIHDDIILAHERKDLELHFFDKSVRDNLWFLYNLLVENIEVLRLYVIEAERLKSEFAYVSCLLGNEI